MGALTLAAGSTYAIANGDKIIIRSPQDNYNTTHFLSGLTPTNNKANKVDTFTLYNGFPESALYGTEIWQVHSYDLWDSSKNMYANAIQDGLDTTAVSVNVH